MSGRNNSCPSDISRMQSHHSTRGSLADIDDAEKGLGTAAWLKGESQNDSPDNGGNSTPMITRTARGALDALGVGEQLRRDNPLRDVFHEHVLQVLDTSYSPETSDRIHEPCVDHKQVDEYLASLPAQEPFTARLLLCGLEPEPFDKVFVTRPSPGIALSAKEVVLNSYMRMIGVHKMNLPRAPEASYLIKMAQQWKTKQNTTWLAAKPLNLYEERWTFMTCSLAGTDKVVALYMIGPKTQTSDTGMRQSWSDGWYAGLIETLHTESYLQKSNGTQQEAQKLLVLGFLRAILNVSIKELGVRVSYIRREYVEYGQQAIDYRVVEEHNKELSRFDTYPDMVQDLVDSIEYVISKLTSNRNQYPRDPAGIEARVHVPLTLQDTFDDIRTSCEN